MGGERPPDTAHAVFSDRARLAGAIYPSCAFYTNKNLIALIGMVTDSCFIYQRRTTA